MKSIIKHKQLYLVFLTLNVIFLSLPVTHAGNMVLCYEDTGRVEIELKLSDDCSSCGKSGGLSQDKTLCYCVDIPISKDVDAHSVLLSSGGIQMTHPASLPSTTACRITSPPLDPLFSSVNHFHLSTVLHESLRTTVLLI